MDGTITRKTKIEYKRRRNPRAFRVWDSAVLGATMVHAAEIKASLEKIAMDHDIEDFDELKPTLIASNLLYLLADSYLDTYKALLSESLLRTGNPKQNPNIH